MKVPFSKAKTFKGENGYWLVVVESGQPSTPYVVLGNLLSRSESRFIAAAVNEKIEREGTK